MAENYDCYCRQNNDTHTNTALKMTKSTKCVDNYTHNITLAAKNIYNNAMLGSNQTA